MFSEILLGFDNRRNPESTRASWTASRRSRYILGTTTDVPLSVDTLVWPSVFDYSQNTTVTAAETPGPVSYGLQPPPWTGPNPGLWEDLGVLLRHSAEAIVGVTWNIAVSIVCSPPCPEGPGMPYPLDGEVPNSAEALGFDIVNSSMLSALSDCAYTREEFDVYQATWGAKLNVHNLFDSPEIALDFVRHANIRVPEEAPFFCAGVYKL